MRSGLPLRTGVLAFLVGVAALLSLAHLPALEWFLLLIPALLLLIFLPAYWRLAASLLVGFSWALLQAQLVLAPSLPLELEGQNVLVQGRVASLPEQESNDRRGRTRFEFAVESLSHAGNIYSTPGRIRLSAYRASQLGELHAGQRWQLLVRLKQARGMMNPGAFDYEAWLFQHRIRATGYVRKSSKNHKLIADTSSCLVLCVREKIRDKIVALTTGNEYTGLLLALSIGERSLITPAQWQWLRQTGTSHLVAISGLHVGLIAGLMFLLVNRFWRLSANLVLFYPAPKAAAWAAMLGALVYAALAGFSVPTQRALIMLSGVMLGIIFNRRLSPGRTLALALLLVLIVDPLAVMAAGFWLSFLAVWVIVYGLAARLGSAGKWRQWWRAQWWVTLGLMPVLLLFFQQVSLIAPLANALAIPLVSMLAAPLSLLGSLLLLFDPDWAAPVLQLALWLLAILADYLRFLAALPYASWSASILSLPSIILCIFGMLWLLAPRGVPVRWLGALMLLPVLFGRFDVPASAEARFTLLDVGQGLAAVVQTKNHLLVFDTGARFGANFNMGDAVLIPFLQNLGIQKIDRLILSHADNDHLGGAMALLAEIPALKIFGSDVEKIKQKGFRLPLKSCLKGQQWNWDGVAFRMLHPPLKTRLQHNNRSCVLMVEAGGQRLLLSGDIEKAAERELVRTYAGDLHADILTAPHHGSKTSSTVAFIDAVSPQYVLYPLGYRNRYGFPHSEVFARYQSRQILSLLSSNTGAIQFTLGANNRQHPEAGLRPQLFRQAQGHFWNAR